jgi:phosphatidylinositol 4-kinase B
MAGFEASAKHSDKIIQLVEIMAKSGCPCFASGPATVSALRRRFHLSRQAVAELPELSIDAWTTRQYDYYQRVLNGIL